MKFLNRGNSDYLRSHFLNVIFLILIGVGTIPIVYADSYGIVLDNTCLTYIKNNLTTICPTYEDILLLFTDNSNKLVSGDFGYKDGIYQRLPTKVHDSYEYYRYDGDKITVFVDPPADTRTRIQMIEIKANLDDYKLANKLSYNASDHSLKMGNDRFVQNCRHAFINAELWQVLLGDTLFHLTKNCSKDSTRFTDTYTTTLSKINHDISTSYKFKLEAWQTQMLNQCGKKVCLYDKNQTSPP